MLCITFINLIFITFFCFYILSQLYYYDKKTVYVIKILSIYLKLGIKKRAVMALFYTNCSM